MVPAYSFAEFAPEPDPQTKKKDVMWFALNDDRPLFFFLRHRQRSGRADLSEAMPVILTTHEERDVWMGAVK